MSNSTAPRRYIRGVTCPVCGGSETDRRGQGSRCFGFLSADGKYAHCTREEHAGECRYYSDSETWAHKLGGPCRCGVEHTPPPPGSGRPKGGKLGRIVATYDYLDADGALVMQATRHEPKDFRQRRPDGKGGWVWDLKGIDPVLYRLPELLAADPAETVFVVEGEKDVDRLRSFGLVATCNPMGAKKWRDHYSGPLRGRRVAILPDNDDDGREHGRRVAASLHGVASEVRVIDLAGDMPELPERGDVSDWLNRGRSIADLRRIADEAPAWTPPAEADGRHHETNGNGYHPPEAPAEGGGGREERPIVVIQPREHLVIDQAVAALASEPTVFQRCNMLVHVLRDAPRKRRRDAARPPGSPRIVPLPTPRLRELLTLRADWRKARLRDGNEHLVESHPPEWAVSGVAARGEWPEIRPIEGIVEAPTLRPDGSVLDVAGWDEETGLLYEPAIRFPSIKATPTRPDAERAAATLLELVGDFPFADDTHRAAWLAALLTPMARFAIDGPTPLFLFDANTPGAGKTLLGDLIAVVVTGRAMARSGYPEADVEMQKLILSIALAGDRLILFDNLPTGAAIGGAALDAALTGTTIKGRVLGRSEVTGDVPLPTVFYASGNNLGLRGDALRRVVPCRLESDEVRPEERDGFKIPDLLAHVRRERPRLVAAALTLLRAYVVAGRPEQGLRPMDYRAWSGLVRNAVCWATGHDPCAPRRDLQANDPESNALAALVAGWRDLCASRGADALTAAEALEALDAAAGPTDDLRGVLMEWSRDGKLPTARIVGNRLNKFRGRPTPFGALDFRVSRGNRSWFVRPPRGGGSGDCGDSVLYPRAENLGSGMIKRGEEKGGRNAPESHQSHQSHHDSASWSAPGYEDL